MDGCRLRPGGEKISQGKRGRPARKNSKRWRTSSRRRPASNREGSRSVPIKRLRPIVIPSENASPARTEGSVEKSLRYLAGIPRSGSVRTRDDLHAIQTRFPECLWRSLKVSSAIPDLSSSPRPSEIMASYCCLVARASGSSSPRSRARSSAIPLSLAACAAEKKWCGTGRRPLTA